MPRESGRVVAQILVAKIIEQQERIELAGVAEAKRPAKLDACAFGRRLGLADAFDGSNRHKFTDGGTREYSPLLINNPESMTADWHVIREQAADGPVFR